MSSAKTILITGGGGGIALEMARQLASRKQSPSWLDGMLCDFKQPRTNYARLMKSRFTCTQSTCLKPGLHSDTSNTPNNLGSTLTR